MSLLASQPVGEPAGSALQASAQLLFFSTILNFAFIAKWAEQIALPARQAFTAHSCIANDIRFFFVDAPDGKCAQARNPRARCLVTCLGTATVADAQFVRKNLIPAGRASAVERNRYSGRDLRGSVEVSLGRDQDGKSALHSGLDFNTCNPLRQYRNFLINRG